MADADGVSLLDESRHELTGGFHPLLLWRDRQRILAQPEIAAQPRPPLANGPIRFALALNLTPLLVIAWLMALLVGLMPGSPGPAAVYETPAGITVEVLEAELPGVDAQGVKALGQSIRRDAMAPEARGLMREMERVLFLQPLATSDQRRDALRSWVARLRASALPLPQQQVLIAKFLHVAHAMRRGDGFSLAIARNVSEGGPLLQVLTVVSLVLGSWLFGQTLRGDARFTNAARADAFYLYYSSSRLFWFIPAQTLLYGAISFASASGNEALLQGSRIAALLLGAASMAYLLLGAPEMARALTAGEAPRGAAWSVAWRMLVSLLVASLAIMMVFAVAGAVAGFVMMATA